MTRQPMPRRRVLQGGLGLAALGATPLGHSALAADEGDSIVAAAKGIGKTDLKAIMWSNYLPAARQTISQQRTTVGGGS